MKRRTALAPYLLLVAITLCCIKPAFASLPQLAPSLAETSGETVSTPVYFKSGPYTLHGRLIAPKMAKAKIPAIVFCVGSSSGSTMANYASFLDSLFQQNLPTDSVALLLFDKRGVGESEGKWYKTDFEERAADAKAAAEYLRTLPFIDSSRIAVAGHSQGGWIAQICVAKYPDTFVGGISLAGPTFDVKEQVRNDYASTLMCEKGMQEKDARNKALSMVNRDFFLASLLPVKENWKQLKVIKKFEPDQYLSNVQKPLLLMFGENDALVSPHYAMAELNRLYPQGLPTNIQTVIIPGANHSFKLSELCYKRASRTLSYSEECKDQIKAWVRTYLFN